jgi:hypothetical protein
MMFKKRIFIVLMLATFLCSLSAQTSTEEALEAYKNAKKAYGDATLELTRIDLRAKKRQLIQKVVTFTPEQSKNYWPIFDKYEAELIKVNDKRLALIQDYAKHYESMTDEKAAELIIRAADFQDHRMALRRRYLTELRDVLPPRIVARLMQLENQTDLLIDLQIASEVPLVK